MTAEQVSDSPSQTISRTARALLAYKGQTYEQFAAAIGIKRSTMYAKMAGNSYWTADEVATVAAYFGVPVQQLFDGLSITHDYRARHLSVVPDWVEYVATETG